MQILTLDLGTSTGWAIRAGGHVESGTQRFELKRGESAGMRFLWFRSWLGETLMNLRPELVAYEVPHHRGGPATELLVGLSTRVQEECAERGIEYQGIHTATLKKHATGSGRASKTDMIAAAKARYPDQVIETDDQADALLILDWVLDTVAAPGC